MTADSFQVQLLPPHSPSRTAPSSPDPRSAVGWDLTDRGLTGSSGNADAASLRWAGGFNPFATYDVVVREAAGSGSVGATFAHRTNGGALSATLLYADGQPTTLTWTVVIAGRHSPRLQRMREVERLGARGRPGGSPSAFSLSAWPATR
jgi:hypothetical protein